MQTLYEAAHAFEGAYLRRALRKFKGNISATAEALDISRRGLTDKILEHGLAELATSLRTKAGIPGPRGDK